MHARFALGVLAIASLAAIPVTASGPKGPSTPKTAGSPKTTITHGNSNKGSSSPSPSTTSGGSTTTSGSATTPATGSSAPLNPIAAKIASKPQLSSQVKALLPSNMTLNQASAGFKNQGQFIAALHVSKNLGIPFADLKTAMTGIRPASGSTTGTTANSATLSLGQAIHKLRPGVDAGQAAERAEEQAERDVRTTTTTTTSSTSTSSTTSSSTTTVSKPSGRR